MRQQIQGMTGPHYSTEQQVATDIFQIGSDSFSPKHSKIGVDVIINNHKIVQISIIFT